MSWIPARISRVALASLLVPTLANAQQSGRPLANEVARALGGADRILSVSTLLLQGTGENYNLGQNLTPSANLTHYAVTQHTRAIDFANARWRLDQTREPRFPTSQTTQRQRHGYDVVAYDITSDTTMRRVGGRLVVDRAAELIYHPVGFFKAALAPSARLTEISSTAGTRRLRLVFGDQTYTMVVDSRTLLPLRTERTTHHGMLGDIVISNEFSDWRDISGVRMPMRTVQKLDGSSTLSDIRITAARSNVEIPDISVPASIKNDPLQPAVVNVTIDSVAPGVYYVTGGTHHSVVVDMGESLILVEAPQSDDRTLAVIRKVRERWPDKGIQAVINTHHHFDHAGGVRAALSEGLNVMTHEANVAFFEQLAKRRFSVVPDALSKKSVPPAIEGVSEKRGIHSNVRSVELYPVTGSAHAGSMLLVYLPVEKLLIEADLYTPQAANVTTPPVAPFAKGLVENIDRLGLAIDRIVPIHGRVVPMSDLRAVAGS